MARKNTRLREIMVLQKKNINYKKDILWAFTLRIYLFWDYTGSAKDAKGIIPAEGENRLIPMFLGPKDFSFL